ncbi:MAG TPA: universal stress protein [Dehalococcoidia bacterium]
MSEIGAARKVLVAWNGSPAAAAALDVARVVGRQLGAEVEVLSVWETAEELERHRQEWERIAAQLQVPFQFAVGDAASEIIRATEQRGVILVSLTTHGREMEQEYRLGRVTEKVVAATTRPVLIVKPEALLAAEARPIRRLLVPLDGTPKTAEALRPVSQLATVLGASIDLLYVAGPDQAPPVERGSVAAPRYVDQAQHEWPQWTVEVIERLANCCAGCPAEIEARAFLAQGEIGEEIARFARENDTDAIVLVRRSRLQPGRAKTIRAVLTLTQCFVIVIGGEEIV